MRILVQLLLLPFPWIFRRWAYRVFFGYSIDSSATIGWSIILAKHLRMGPKSRIHHGVFCKAIDLLELGEDSGIANFTFITGYSVSKCKQFAHVEDRKCELVLGRSAGITSRHFVDCNGGVYIGEFTTVAGIRTQILTHSIDVYHNRQDARPIKIGKYCFIGTGCILLPGSSLPDYCILGAGSVLTKSQSESACLYAGSPAVARKKLNEDEIPYFRRTKHVVD